MGPPPLPSVDQLTQSLHPYAQQARDALQTLSTHIDPQRSPQLYALTQKLTTQFNRATGHYEGLAGVVHRALGVISPQQRDVLKGQYTGIEDRLLNNAGDTNALLEEIGGMISRHPDLAQLRQSYTTVRTFYDRAVDAAKQLKPLRDTGFANVTPSQHWYDHVPGIRDLAHSSKGRLLRIGLGLLFAAAGVYLYTWYRRRHQAAHPTLPRVEKFS